MIVVSTIPHSGSRLLVDEILKTPWQALANKPKPGFNYFEHIYTHNAPLHKMRMEQYSAIVTLRHPLLVASSWKQRGMDIGEMCVCWYILVEQLDKYEPLYLPIDAKDRDEYLNKINQKLGLDLQTDWPLVNSKFHTDKPIDLGEDQAQVDRLISNISDFLKRFYPRKPRGYKKRNSNQGSAKTDGIGS